MLGPRLITVVLAAVAVAGCDMGGGGDDDRSRSERAARAATNSSPPPSHGSTVVTRDDGSLPRRCGPRRVAGWIAEFFDAYNRGERTKLERLIAPIERFQWYFDGLDARGGRFSFSIASPTSDIGDVEKDVRARERLLDHFARRHAVHDQVQLREVVVSRVPPGQWVASDETLAGVDFTASRRSDELARIGRKALLLGGKGALACGDGALVVWSMGGSPSEERHVRRARLCPPPKSRARRGGRERVVIACTGPSGPR